MSENINDKPLNNVQKVKLEDFLENEKEKILNKLSDKYEKQKDAVIKKLEQNKPKKVLILHARLKEIDKICEKLGKERELKRDLINKEGFRFSTYDDKLKLSYSTDYKEIQKINDTEHEKRDKIVAIYENTILKVWTGLQSETADLVDKMIKAMNKLI